MLPILLKPLLHRGAEQIGIFFEKDKETNDVVRTIRELNGRKRMVAGICH
jgi:hypothetical protein